MSISDIMSAHNITPESDISQLDVALRLHQAWMDFTNQRTLHWIRHQEWLPSYFEKEAERFFGGRYTEDEVHDYWVRADEHLCPPEVLEAETERVLAEMSDEDRAEVEEMSRDLYEFIAKRREQREKDNAILAEIAKEFE